MNIRIYTDGSCLANGKEKNVGGFGFVALDEKDNILFETTHLAYNTTNNRMELEAILKAFEYIKNLSFSKCTIYSDSKYCVDGFNDWLFSWIKRNWKEVKNRDLWEKMWVFKQAFKSVRIDWIRGHQNKNTWNDYIDSKIALLHANNGSFVNSKINNKNNNNMSDILIDIPLTDLSDQKYTVNNGYSIVLTSKYLKLSYDFCADEKDYEVYYENKRKYADDEILYKAFEGHVPEINVCRKQISYYDKNTISSIALIKESNTQDKVTSVIVTINSGEEVVFLIKEYKKAEELLETLQNWKFNS